MNKLTGSQPVAVGSAENIKRNMLVKDAIYALKRLKLDELERTSPLGKWFYEMVQKSVDELTLSDVLRMLRQEVYHDIAIPFACTKVLEDPFCGEMYAEEVQQKWETFEWESNFEKEECEKLLFQLNLLFE